MTNSEKTVMVFLGIREVLSHLQVVVFHYVSVFQKADKLIGLM